MHTFARRMARLLGTQLTTLHALGALLAAGALSASVLAGGCARDKPCELNSDCVNAYCDNGACKKDCVDAERDCAAGYVCSITAQCVPGDSGPSSSSSGGPGGGGAGGSSTSSSSSGSGTGGMTSSSSSSSSSSGNPGTKHELDLCGSDAECAPQLVCRAMTRGGAKRCTRTCSSNSGCMSGTRCEVVDGTKYCAGDDAGRPCNSAAPCNFACINSQQVCTVECVTGSDCPNGWGCMAIGNPATSVCVKAEEPCSSQDPASKCIVPAACDESASMVVGGCTLACNTSNDCPRRAAGLAAWSCDAGGICRRPPDVHGPLETGYSPAQYACFGVGNVVNVCNDNLHIDFDSFSIPAAPGVNCNSPTTTDGFPGDSCVDSCRYQGGCPYGSACIGVGNIGNARIGLCLPSGSGEVGTACAHDSQCAFGYCASGACSRDCTADGVCPTGSTCVAAGGPPVEGAPFKRCQ